MSILKTILGKTWVYLLIGLLCVALWHTNSKVEKYSKLSHTLENTINDQNQQIKQIQICLDDTIKVWQAEVAALNYTQANLKAKYDKLLSASNLKPKDVNSVTEVTTVVHSVDTVIAVVDSFGGIKAEMVDPFVSIGVEVLPDRNTIIDYEVRDSLTVIDVQKKHSWLFGLIKWKEHKGVRVINHNPRATIQSLQTIDVIEK